MRYVIYGPPGAGKSTLARLVPTVIKDATVVHLEQVAQPQRLPLLLFLAYMDFDLPLFVTAADLSPEMIPRDRYHILFLFPEPKDRWWEQYNRRNEEESRPHQEVAEMAYDSMGRKKERNPEIFRMIVNPFNYGDPAGTLTYIMRELNTPRTP